jgi:hypothetical protein
MQPRRATHFLRGLLFLAAATLAAGAAAADLGARSSNNGGVSVSVTPKVVSPTAAAWEFSVVLNTHTQDLSDDLLKNTVLIDAQGGRHSPTAWEGAPPGGHHRSGVLRFKGLGVQAGALELLIQRAGEAAPRSFRWKLE